MGGGKTDRELHASHESEPYKSPSSVRRSLEDIKRASSGLDASVVFQLLPHLVELLLRDSLVGIIRCVMQSTNHIVRLVRSILLKEPPWRVRKPRRP